MSTAVCGWCSQRHLSCFTTEARGRSALFPAEACTHTIWARYPAPRPPGPALRHCPSKRQGQLTRTPQLMRGKGLSYSHILRDGSSEPAQGQLYWDAQARCGASSSIPPWQGVGSLLPNPLYQGPFFSFWETESHYVALTGLDFTMQTQLALNSQRFACLCLADIGIKSMKPHAWPALLLFNLFMYGFSLVPFLLLVESLT